MNLAVVQNGSRQARASASGAGPWSRPQGALFPDRLFARAPIAMLVFARDLRCLTANDAMAKLLGHHHAPLVAGRTLAELVPDAAPIAAAAFDRLPAGGEIADGEVGWRGRRFLLSFGPALNLAGGNDGLVMAMVDITRHARMEQGLRQSRRRLLEYACNDHLTGLLNRRGLDALLNRELRRADRERTPLSFLIADIDWFKPFNDARGHLAGDECLRRVAGALRGCLRRGADRAARFGGEEFAAVLPGSGPDGAEAVAEACRAAVAALGIEHPDSPYGVVTISLGAAPLDAALAHLPVKRRLAALVQAADDALYRAKAGGRNRVACC